MLRRNTTWIVRVKVGSHAPSDAIGTQQPPAQTVRAPFNAYSSPRGYVSERAGVLKKNDIWQDGEDLNLPEGFPRPWSDL